jgi:fermentation-respiration switch protein FrsA (DUF1100 family)
MATNAEVLSFLIPNGGFVMTGDDFDSVEFIEAKPITKAQFQAGFGQYDAWKAEQDAKAETAKANAQAKLAALGLTADDLKALGL